MTHNNYKRLGDYIRQVDVRNKDLAVEKLLGLSIAKQFIPSIANTIGTDMRNYKVVEPGHTIISYQDLTLYNLERKEQMQIDSIKEAKEQAAREQRRQLEREKADKYKENI